MYIKRFSPLLWVILLFIVSPVSAQRMLSIASDVNVQRNFKRTQQYWAFGHTTQAVFHFTPRDGLYTMISFYSRGRFENRVTATAKVPFTTPSEIQYVNKASMGLKEFSLGWRHYLVGNADSEKFNIYSGLGFGLEFGRVINTPGVIIDTNQYRLPVRPGDGKFKRMTWDLALGFELPLMAEFYFYTEARLWIPASDYPSKYLFVNERAPLAGMLGMGVRLVF